MHPKLRNDLQWTPWGDHFLLFNPNNRSTLRIKQEDKSWIEGLDGSKSLANLEDNTPQSTQLLDHLEKLCRGEFFANSDELFGFLFPNQQRNQWSAQRRNWVNGVLKEWSIKWPLSLPSPTLIFILSLILFVVGAAWMLKSGHNFASHPWVVDNSWLKGTVSSYLCVSLVLSVVGVVQMSLVRHFSNEVPMQLKHLFGIVYIGTSRHQLFHTPTAVQRQFSGLGLGLILGSIGLCWMVEAQTGSGTGASLASALMLLLLWDFCPFYDTDGAQLFETVSIHKQRLRTQDFLRTAALRGQFGDVEGQHGLRLTLCVWLMWFGVAIHLLGQTVLPHLSTFLSQSLKQTHPVGMVWLGVVFGLIGIYYVYFVFQGIFLSKDLLQQLYPSASKVQQTSIAPFEKVHIETALNDCNIRVSTDPKSITTISKNTRVDSHCTGNQIWVLLKGEVAYVDPKPEGGFATLLQFPTPTIIANTEQSSTLPTMWSSSDATMVGIPTSSIESASALDTHSDLHSTPYFASLPDVWKWVIATQARRQTLSAGDTLLTKGDPADALYCTVSGEFSVETNPPKQLTAGSLAGEMGILSESPRNATIRCSSDGDVIIIPAHIIRVCMQNCPTFGTVLEDLMRSRQGDSNES